MKHPDRSPQKSFQRLNIKELGLQPPVEQKAPPKTSLIKRVTVQLGALLSKKTGHGEYR